MTRKSTSHISLLRRAGFLAGAAGVACLAAAHTAPPQAAGSELLLPAGVLLLGLGIGLWLTGWLTTARVSCQDDAIRREAEEQEKNG